MFFMFMLHAFITGDAQASQIQMKYGYQAYLHPYIKPGSKISLETQFGRGQIKYGFQYSLGIFNGNYYEEQVALGCSSAENCIQGDINVHRIGVSLNRSTPKWDFSLTPIISSFPLLMDPTYYEEKIVPSFGSSSLIHEGLKPGVALGFAKFWPMNEQSLLFGIFSEVDYTVDVGGSYSLGLQLKTDPTSKNVGSYKNPPPQQNNTSSKKQNSGGESAKEKSAKEKSTKGKSRAYNPLISIGLGTGMYPYGGEYYGRIFKNNSLENEEVYTWQTVTKQASRNLQLGFGVQKNRHSLKILLGRGLSKFWVDYHSISETNYSKAQGAQDYSSQVSIRTLQYAQEYDWFGNMSWMWGLEGQYVGSNSAQDFLQDFPPDGIPSLKNEPFWSFGTRLGLLVQQSSSFKWSLEIPITKSFAVEPQTYIEGGDRLEASERVDYSNSEIKGLNTGLEIFYTIHF